MHPILALIYELLNIYKWVLIIYVILDWLIAFNVINMQSGAVRSVLTALDRITAPLYRPIRKIMPDFGGIDFSPIVVILALNILRKLVGGLALEVGPTLT